MEDNIKKIVELEIDLDNIEMEEMGVDVVSLVTEPAIEVDFLAFNADTSELPIYKDETGDLKIKREFGELYDTKEEAEAKAKELGCEGAHKMLDKWMPCDYHIDFDLEDACWPGYEAIGMKNKNGKLVPNCVPIEASKEEFESYSDYPQEVKNNAQRGIDLNEKEGNKCATQTGKVRAQQLAQGKPISVETIMRMYSYLSRAEVYYDENDQTSCGTISYLLWGGKSAKRWAKMKLEELGQLEASLTVSFEDEIHEAILEWAEEYGESMTSDYEVVDLSKDEFANIGEVTGAIRALDILGKLGIKKGEEGVRKYRYSGPRSSNSRSFCSAMLNMDKLYSDGDMRMLRGKLGNINPGMGPNGRDSYSVFKYKGGVNCRHYWSEVSVFKAEGTRKTLVIEKGPAKGDAGKSNNSRVPSPKGSVTNNARKNFSFSVLDEDKRIVAGPLMIANQMIPRINQDGDKYYVYFSADTIRRIQERFNKQLKQNNTDTQHDGEIMNDNILLEQWIIEHPTYDKSRFYGFMPLPKGSWFGAYKINDDETWRRVKNGELKGFSVAGNFLEKAKPINKDDETLSNILKILKDTNE